MSRPSELREERRRLLLSRAVGAATIAGLWIWLGGPSALAWLIPTTIASLAAIFFVGLVIDRRVHSSRPADSALTIVAAVDADHSSPSLVITSGEGSGRFLKTLSAGRPSGRLDIVSGGIRWRPTRLSRRMGFGSISLRWADRKSLAVKALIPGLASMFSIVRWTGADGSDVTFYVRNGTAVKQVLKERNLSA